MEAGGEEMAETQWSVQQRMSRSETKPASKLGRAIQPDRARQVKRIHRLLILCDGHDFCQGRSGTHSI